METQSAASLEREFGIVATDWMSIVGRVAPIDETRFKEIRAEAQRIVDAGNWTSGPSDLLTVVGRHRDELLHSRVLGWLMTPTGRHGLGRLFLRHLHAELWPEDQTVDTGSVTVELERTQSGMSDATGELLEARADIVVRTDGLVMVIENKVGAGEQPLQCERLFWAWAQEPTETRWVYLTPTGRSPSSAVSAPAISAWVPLSYRQVRRALVAALEEAGEGATHQGRSSAQQYLWTLDAQTRS